MMDGKAEGQVPVCQPVTKMFSREHSWERRWEAGPVRGVRAAGQPGFPGNRGLEVPRSPPAWGYQLGEVGSQFSSGSIRRFFSSFLNSLLSNDSWGMELCSPATKSLLYSGLAMKKPLPEGKPSLWGRKLSPTVKPLCPAQPGHLGASGPGEAGQTGSCGEKAARRARDTACPVPPPTPPPACGGPGLPFQRGPLKLSRPLERTWSSRWLPGGGGGCPLPSSPHFFSSNGVPAGCGGGRVKTPWVSRFWG